MQQLMFICAVSMNTERGELMMNEMVMLDIRHYSKTYGGGKKAADDVTISVMSGDI